MNFKLQCEDERQQVLLPAITKDVNEGRNFANLRQIYHSLILAKWFKTKLKDSLYAAYIDQHKLKGIDTSDPALKEKIFGLYVQSFEKGVYDVIRGAGANNHSPIQERRRFFSGGVIVGNIPVRISSSVTSPDNVTVFGKLIQVKGFNEVIDSESEYTAKINNVFSSSTIILGADDDAVNLWKIPSINERVKLLKEALEGDEKALDFFKRFAAAHKNPEDIDVWIDGLLSLERRRELYSKIFIQEDDVRRALSRGMDVYIAPIKRYLSTPADMIGEQERRSMLQMVKNIDSSFEVRQKIEWILGDSWESIRLSIIEHTKSPAPEPLEYGRGMVCLPLLPDEHERGWYRESGLPGLKKWLAQYEAGSIYPGPTTTLGNFFGVHRSCDVSRVLRDTGIEEVVSSRRENIGRFTDWMLNSMEKGITGVSMTAEELGNEHKLPADTIRSLVFKDFQIKKSGSSSINGGIGMSNIVVSSFSTMNSGTLKTNRCEALFLSGMRYRINAVTEGASLQDFFG